MSRVALALVCTFALAPTASAESPDTQRFVVSQQITLPVHMWFAAERDVEARVVAWELKAVLSCAPAAVRSTRREGVACRVDDVGLRAAAFPGDEVPLGKLIAEVDERLEGTTLRMSRRADGRFTRVDVEGLPFGWRRVNMMRENLKLVLTRVAAAFEWPDPAESLEWTQRSAWMLRLPTAQGTQGYARLDHHVTTQDDHVQHIATQGRGHAVAGEDLGIAYGMSYSGQATVDAATGALRARSWQVTGEPTPGSRISDGRQPQAYRFTGELRALAEDEPAPEVGDAGTFEPPDGGWTLIQASESLGRPVGVADGAGFSR